MQSSCMTVTNMRGSTPPANRRLTTAELAEDGGGLRWEAEDGTVLRFKSLDMLRAFLQLP